VPSNTVDRPMVKLDSVQLALDVNNVHPHPATWPTRKFCLSLPATVAVPSCSSSLDSCIVVQHDCRGNGVLISAAFDSVSPDQSIAMTFQSMLKHVVLPCGHWPSLVADGFSESSALVSGSEVVPSQACSDRRDAAATVRTEYSVEVLRVFWRPQGQRIVGAVVVLPAGPEHRKLASSSGLEHFG
jgi:hypothetical protein